MNKYPRFTFRLDTERIQKLNLLARARHRTRARVLREALDLYFRAHYPAIQSSLDNVITESVNSGNQQHVEFQ
jgi:predicted transcriptional regulator